MRPDRGSLDGRIGKARKRGAQGGRRDPGLVHRTQELSNLARRAKAQKSVNQD